MDRHLQPLKRRLGRRLYGRTKPGSLLKHHIHLQTSSWAEARPGFTEIDLVSHSGNAVRVCSVCAAKPSVSNLQVAGFQPIWPATKTSRPRTAMPGGRGARRS
jgi:hypothetical protein